MTLSDILMRQAATRPAAIAARVGGGDVSYGVLARVIAKAAARLEREGIGPGASVGITKGDRYWNWVVQLAALRLGARTVMPLTPAAQRALGEIDFTVSALPAPRAARGRTKSIVLAEDQLEAAEPAEAPLAAVDPAAATAASGRWFLSSGTTGEAKVIFFDGRRIEARLSHLGSSYGIDIDERTRAFTMIGVASSPGFYLPMATWMAGGTVLLPGGGVPGHEDAFRRSNLIMTSPVGLQDLLRSFPDDRAKDAERVIAVAGGRLAAVLRDQALARLCGRVRLVYGASEVGGVAGGDSAVIDRHPGAVGFVRPGAELQVVDGAGRPAATEVEGAVRVRSDSMASGYVNDPSATAHVFRDGWFYSGDLGMVFGDGLLAITGRVSEVLNLGGVKLAPEVIEDKLRTLDRVRDICVLAVPDRGGVERLAVVAVCDEGLDMKDLRAAIAQRMPRPKRFLLVRVPKIPRNPMGKVPRRKLAAQIVARLEHAPSPPD